jgi:hypothetical protein
VNRVWDDEYQVIELPCKDDEFYDGVVARCSSCEEVCNQKAKGFCINNCPDYYRREFSSKISPQGSTPGLIYFHSHAPSAHSLAETHGGGPESQADPGMERFVDKPLFWTSVGSLAIAACSSMVIIVLCIRRRRRILERGGCLRVRIIQRVRRRRGAGVGKGGNGGGMGTVGNHRDFECDSKCQLLQRDSLITEKPSDKKPSSNLVFSITSQPLKSRECSHTVLKPDSMPKDAHGRLGGLQGTELEDRPANGSGSGGGLNVTGMKPRGSAAGLESCNGAGRKCDGAKINCDGEELTCSGAEPKNFDKAVSGSCIELRIENVDHLNFQNKILVNANRIKIAEREALVAELEQFISSILSDNIETTRPIVSQVEMSKMDYDRNKSSDYDRNKSSDDNQSQNFDVVKWLDNHLTLDSGIDVADDMEIKMKESEVRQTTGDISSSQSTASILHSVVGIQATGAQDDCTADRKRDSLTAIINQIFSTK